MHVEVRPVDLSYIISPAELGLNCVQTLHLEVLVPEMPVEGAKVQTASDLRRVLLLDGKEGAPETVLGVVWELLYGRTLQVVLQSGGACLELRRARGQASC